MPGDPVRCCILGVCCPPGSAEQRAALAQFLMDATANDDAGAVSHDACMKMAAALLADFKLVSH